MVKLHPALIAMLLSLACPSPVEAGDSAVDLTENSCGFQVPPTEPHRDHEPSFATERPEVGDEIRLCGRVTDKHGEGLAGAGVAVVGRSGCYCLCASDGCFDLKIPQAGKNDSIAVSFLGYKAVKKALNDCRGFAEIQLEESPYSLNSIIIQANPDFSEAFCQERLEKLDIYLSPVAAGDPLNALQTLPSVSGIRESANPEFRGSDAWASRVIFNGIAIDQPVRNTQLNGLGNFSLFNTELIDHLSVYPGPVPLTLTRSTSGAVDIHTIDSLESPQRQLAVSVAEVGGLMGLPWRNAFLQVYGNVQFSPIYTQMNHTEERLKCFSSYDLGMLGGLKKGHSSFKFFRYAISEKYEGVQTQLNRSDSCEARQERQFGVFNYRYAQQSWLLEANLGEDASHSRHAQGNDVYSLHNQHLEANISLKHWTNGNFRWQAGWSLENRRCTGGREHEDSLNVSGVMVAFQDSLINHRQTDGFLSARWQSENGLSLAATLRASPKGTVLSAEDVSAQIVLNLPFGLYHHGQISAGNNQSHAGPWFQRMEFCELKSRQASLDYRYDRPDLKCCLNVYVKQESGPVAMDYDLDILDAERRIFGWEAGISKEYGGFVAEVTCSRIHSRLRFGEKASRNQDVLAHYGIKSGQDYPAANDLPYLVKGSLQYHSPEHFCIALSGMMRSGACITPVEGGIYAADAGCHRPIFGEYHSGRLPTYRRFDLSLNKVIFQGGPKMTVLFATFSNVFNRINTMGNLYSPDFRRQLGSLQAEPYSLYFGIRQSW